MTVATIVLLFSFFVLFYLPAIQESYLLGNFNKEVQNHANTVALGVKIAMTEQNFEGVKTAMDFVKKEPQLQYVSLLQVDTSWNNTRTKYRINKTVFKTYPETKAIDINAQSDDSTVIKRSSFSTPLMKGEILLAASTDEIIQSKKQIRFTSLLFSSLVFAIGIFIGFALARNISIPVLELRDAATKVGRGDLTQRVVNTSRDEIGELGIAFNKMVSDLSKARLEIDDRTKELIVEKRKSDDLLLDLQKTFTDLKNTQEQLIRQEKLASIGQLTKGLVDRLLNPLNYINNFSSMSKGFLNESKEILSEEKFIVNSEIHDDVVPLLDKAEMNVEKINEHGLNLTRIVRSMEKLLQSKSNHYVVTNINSFIENLLTKYKNELKHSYTDFPLEISTVYHDKSCTIKILPDEMSSVIHSLLSNAVYSLYEKFAVNTDFVPKISIKTRCMPGHIEITVEDNGKGIAEDEQTKIFSPFFTTKPTSIGTGLGLFISQDIVKTHKGTISVKSEIGSYTAFIIQLPLT